MKEKKVIKAMSGNEAAAYVSYAFTEVTAIYPITPSTPMAEYVDEWASLGKKNLFGMPVQVVELQSESGAAGTMHGSLQMGVLTSSYTCSQGLLLKIPNMYKIAGQMLPGVMYVASRSLAAQSLSIFGDHQDVMATRQTGFAMLASGSVQEVMDLSGVAHLSAIRASVPFMHFFDGFRTSHETNTIEVIDYSVFAELLDRKALSDFRSRSLNPSRPVIRGTSQGEDVYFQTKILQNSVNEKTIQVVLDYMNQISKQTGRYYAPFVYYGCSDATEVIIALGSVNETIKETVDYLNATGRKVGLVTVHLYRPFSIKHLLSVVPNTVKGIAVLERTIEPGSIGGPLYLDVKSSFYDHMSKPIILGGIYGLSSKDTTPQMIISVYDNLINAKKNNFTIGIDDDVTYTSLEFNNLAKVVPKNTKEFLFYGMGSDGTVGASTGAVEIIGDNTKLYTQSYASYDSKKSGGVTRVHVRISKNPIRSTYLVSNPDFVSVSNENYLMKYDVLKGIRDNGTLLVNTTSEMANVKNIFSNEMKQTIIDKKLNVYIINAVDGARSLGLGKRTNIIMQSAFFKLNEDIIAYDKSVDYMKQFITQTYSKAGLEIVEMNQKAILAGSKLLKRIEVDQSWLAVTPLLKESQESFRPSFVKNISDVINRLDGDTLPVSAFSKYIDGSMPVGTAKFEKRGIANYVPRWDSEKCIQCNKCVFACPHAVIRAFLTDEKERKNAPENATLVKARGKGLEKYDYTLQISALDCTECGLCVDVCPVPQKALEMVSIQEELARNHVEHTNYFFNEVTYKNIGTNNTKNLSFNQPLFEFSGACAGCGETPYIKALTQLFGSQLVIANATGCTSIFSGSYPSSPYTTNIEGFGPAWANSLFEDNAEFGFGMKIAYDTMQKRLENIMQVNKTSVSIELSNLFDQWLLNKFDAHLAKKTRDKIVKYIEGNDDEVSQDLMELKDYMYKISQWIIGGDGWAYDIGFSGIDHVIANNLDVNILVLDTEVYSNTGGQSSKAARSGSIAKFSAIGKQTQMKDLAMIAMSYENAYVAQISHGYSSEQVIKVFKEAEAFNGPSIIIAYAPCIEHKIDGGMAKSFSQAKLAVECGYWPTFRYNPRLVGTTESPFQMDSKPPKWDKYLDYLLSEGRYRQINTVNPKHAKELLDKNLFDAKRRYEAYLRLK